MVNTIKKNVKKFFPLFLRDYLRGIQIFIYNIPYIGKGLFCPVCGKTSRRFGECGRPVRKNALCMRCRSKERDRLGWLYLINRTDLFDGRGKAILHIAPERGLKKQLKKRFRSGYITADLFDREVMVKMDITDIQYEDRSFDVIYCSHVLEHVCDDKQAIREFYRVLKPNGWVIIMVPIKGEKTFEDPNITNPVDRFRLFGQEDHVRQYGLDVVDRLSEAGFDVTCIKPTDFLNKQEISNMAITEAAGKIFLCRKL